MPSLLLEAVGVLFLCMHEYFLPSSFSGTKTTLYHYPAANGAFRTVFILKGLYGGHTPSGNSWDNELVSLLRSNHNDVILVRTGRKDAEDKKEQFEGKTYQQECQDFVDAVEYCKENVVRKGTPLCAIAMSFGGTTLLGLPSVLQSMNTVVFIGSGCDRNPETKKPLLSTLPSMETLLASIEAFKGSFAFLHGGNDTVVPLDSQQKIFTFAKNARVRAWIEYPTLDHELNDPSGSQLAVLASKHFAEFS